jgi:hypothetical protein
MGIIPYRNLRWLAFVSNLLSQVTQGVAFCAWKMNRRGELKPHENVAVHDFRLQRAV